jgi:hypothetical protein
MSLQAANYVQDQFGQKIREIDTDRKSAARGRNWRRWVAYLLKAIAIFGGIAVASGLEQQLAQKVGVAILMAAGVDLWLSNSKALVIYAQAVDSYDALRKRAERRHQTDLIPILVAVEDEDAEASDKLVAMVGGLLDMCNVELERIEKALREGNLETLKALEIENKKQTS